MPRIDGTTDTQSRFLRSFRSPAGPSADQWPSPAVLRRWMRRPRFRLALQSLRDTLRFEADLQLARAASLATHSMNSALATCADPAIDLRPRVHALTHILRLSHSRQRFAPPDPISPDSAPDPAKDPSSPRYNPYHQPVVTLEFLRKVHPNCSIATVLDLIKSQRPDLFEE